MKVRTTFAVALLLALAMSAEVVVTGVGRAPGDERTAREQALTEALRDAVRQGAGVDLVSATKVSNYVLEYDRVFATAFGYVRDYKVLESGLDEVGDYVVKVSATVGKGAPDVEDRLLVRQIIRLKGAPRLAVVGEEKLNGARGQAPAGASALAARAVELGFRVVATEVADTARERRAAREDLLGDSSTAALRRAGATAGADLLVTVRTSVEVGKAENVYGSALRSVSLNLDLAVARTDSAETLVRLSPPAVKLTSSGSTPEAALADALKAHFANGAADAFLRTLLVRWVTELDLGALVRLEIRGIDRDGWRGLVGALRDSPGIGSLWERDFDARHLSLVDVESRLTSEQLADRVEQALGGAFQADKVTMAALSFVPVVASAEPDAPSLGDEEPVGGSRRWRVAALVVAGLLLAVVGGALFARR
jgi:hypothetical protein